jgi:hypothetical protein
MTPLEGVQLSLAWLSLLAAVTGMLSAAASRLPWAASAMLLSAWLAVTQSAELGTVLATGTLAGLAVERSALVIKPEFSRLTRHLALTVAALVAAVVVLVRLAHVDAAQAPYVFPVVATGLLALVALFAASEQAEINRAVRLLLVAAAASWTVATQGGEPAAVVAVAAALPLVALSGRPRDHTAGETAP